MISQKGFMQTKEYIWTNPRISLKTFLLTPERW